MIESDSITEYIFEHGDDHHALAVFLLYIYSNDIVT